MFETVRKHHDDLLGLSLLEESEKKEAAVKLKVCNSGTVSCRIGKTELTAGPTRRLCSWLARSVETACAGLHEHAILRTDPNWDARPDIQHGLRYRQRKSVGTSAHIPACAHVHTHVCTMQGHVRVRASAALPFQAVWVSVILFIVVFSLSGFAPRGAPAWP